MRAYACATGPGTQASNPRLRQSLKPVPLLFAGCARSLLTVPSAWPSEAALMATGEIHSLMRAYACATGPKPDFDPASPAVAEACSSAFRRLRPISLITVPSAWPSEVGLHSHVGNPLPDRRLLHTGIDAANAAYTWVPTQEYGVQGDN